MCMDKVLVLLARKSWINLPTLNSPSPSYPLLESDVGRTAFQPPSAGSQSLGGPRAPSQLSLAAQHSKAGTAKSRKRKNCLDTLEGVPLAGPLASMKRVSKTSKTVAMSISATANVFHDYVANLLHFLFLLMSRGIRQGYAPICLG